MGTAESGNKSTFHMLCLDAALPPVEQMDGWPSLSEHEKNHARTLYSSHRSARGGTRRNKKGAYGEIKVVVEKVSKYLCLFVGWGI